MYIPARFTSAINMVDCPITTQALALHTYLTSCYFTPYLPLTPFLNILAR